ncbi:PARP-domain-containing protein [Piromyces finnis]|uniref:Poly [ADP-ribose] polymerase n=1 Tax=Piromyces finnis TaxID=1754191 RepID=A0A1Y1VGC9_9FUNG|nr:PARP-domain-containing protein [Piromyces finnis]|eukprot:ORX55486.1 PARP-domain-containing protein [Piromyces finnis]
MSLRRSARINAKANQTKQGTFFQDLVFTLSPATNISVENRITNNGGKIQKTYTKKVNYLIATKEELAENELSTKIKNALDNPECKIVDESYITNCIKENKLIDAESYILKPPSEEEKKTHTPVIPKRKYTRKSTKKDGEEKPTKRKRATTSKNESKGSTKEKGKKEVKEEDPMDVDDSKKKEEDGEEEEEEEEEIVKEIRKGRTVVDPNVPNSNDYHVLEEGDEIYDAILNQTNIANNNNKFYNLQVLKKDNSNQYCFWTRWGRVGEKGQSSLLNCSSKDIAISNFKSKFKDKTGNNWSDRNNFVKKNKKYFLLERDYGVTEEDEKRIKEKEKEIEQIDIPDSKLDEKVQDIIKLIFDISLMEQQMSEIGYNAKKMPLGKLTKEHIKKSFAVLKKLDDELNNKVPKPSVLSDLTSEFYTIIPHDFGRTRPPVINTKVLLKKKIEMVESLADIQIATTLLKNQKVEITENPIDMNYKSLHCDLTPLDHNSEEFEMIKTYVANTHAKTHSWYELEVGEAYIVDREGEKERFLGNKYPDKKRKLLWHGSRITNFAGILSQGLRIAPPEAPVTGYMFGKGVYFADMVSKSANYCCASSNHLGLMLLCEVMTGEENNLLYADYNAGSLAKENNKDCTKGCGRNAPDPTKSAYTKDGIEVPYGPAIDVTLDKDGSLLYNEYIVYDVAQIKMRYLIKMKFNKPKN